MRESATESGPATPGRAGREPAPLAEPDSDLAPWQVEARRLVGDLFRRTPAIYWTDFLLSAAGAWAATAVYLNATTWSAMQVAAFLIAGVLFFRAGTFMHEIVHMPARQMLAFKRAWNLLIGVPMLMPWVLYRNHLGHHSHLTFGTPDDGEYLPLATSPLPELLKYLAQAPLLPLFMIARFGILGPLSWLHPRLREWVLTRVSAAVSNPYYAKRFPERDEGHLKTVEALCFAWLVALGALTWQGAIRPQHLFLVYLLLAWTLGLNWVRNLAAHRYANAGSPVSHGAQVEESINLVGQTWLTLLLFPVGLRYHALHHLFPALPYHRMGTAHRRLMQNLPPDSPYRAVNHTSFAEVVGELWRSARATSRAQSAMRRWSPGSARP